MAFSAQQGIARFLRIFPRLALFFLVLHVTVIIYTVLKPNHAKITPTPETPPGVVDMKMRNVVIAENKSYNNDDKLQDNQSLQKMDDLSRNKTKPRLLERLKFAQHKTKHKPVIH